MTDSTKPALPQVKELRDLLKEAAFEGKRVIYGACHYWFCRFCGGSGDCIEPLDHEYAVRHRDYCPIYKALKGTEAAR